MPKSAVNKSVKDKTKTTSKIKDVKGKGTLDQKHMEQLNKLKMLRDSLPEKKKLLSKKLNELTKLNKKSDQKQIDICHQKAILAEDVERLRNEIRQIENYSETLQYASKTIGIVLDYYNDGDIVECVTERVRVETPPIKKSTKKDISFWVKLEVDDSSSTRQSPIPKTTISKNKPNNDVPVSDFSRKASKAKLFDKYLLVTDSKYQPKTTSKNHLCRETYIENGVEKKCEGTMTPNPDGCLVCDHCGVSEKILVATDKPNYKETAQDNNTYAYKRKNHLTEILSQLQAKETTEIPASVYEALNLEIKKRKIDRDSIDMFKMRRILKQLGLRRYYEHVAHILQIINGRQPPNFSRSDETKIKKMFDDIQKPFAEFCPKDRKNFLNYSYFLHKACELLDLDSFISYFPLLKNKNKLRQHDKIWKNICKYMRWQFYKST
jgi:hypothetical protein